MRTNRILNRIVVLMLIVASMALLIPQNAKAATTVIVRAPFTGTVVVAGKTLTDANVTDYGYMDGRIQKLVANNYSLLYKYKDYEVTINALTDVVVYDEKNTALTYTIRGNVMDFTSSSDPAFMQAMTERIKGAAIAYHNRVGGYSGTTFGSYFLNGSDAYIKACNSDGGRRWGQYVRAGVINSVDVSEVFRYSDDVFSAKVHVSASGSYFEIYDIYLLFKKTGDNYYVTYFTYQD